MSQVQPDRVWGRPRELSAWEALMCRFESDARTRSTRIRQEAGP
jgi:hypothetical protein